MNSNGKWRALKRGLAAGIRCGGRLALALVWLAAGPVRAADVAADFAAANDLYAKGKFADAAAAYQKVLGTGAQSPNLLFNCGNAEFKAGHLGRAICAYRRAEGLTPRDAELRANLAFVRTQVPGATVRESRWRAWLSALTLNEGAVLTAVIFWALMGLLTARQLRPGWTPGLRGVTRLVAALTLLSATALALQAAGHFHSSVAVVTVGEAAGRTGPLEDAQTGFTARDGAELRVRDRHGDWVQAADGTGRIGWFSTRQVEVLPGA
jgi:tetratricopeptide (TPR) repeat protein